MRIIPFPQPDPPQGEQTLTEIEAALQDEAVGASAQYWRELRADVRALAPPMSPELETELRSRIELRVAAEQRHLRARFAPRAAVAGVRAWLGLGPRASVLVGSGLCVVVAILALVVVAPWGGSNRGNGGDAFSSSGVAAPHVTKYYKGSESARASGGVARESLNGAVTAPKHRSSAPALAPAALPAKAAASSQSSTAGPEPENAPASGRVQQLGASLALAPKPEEVQSVADQVAQLATRDGGYVQSSQVHLQRGSGGEASIQLSLPSARLSTALAAISRLAPMRAENQSLQDITDEYDAAKRKLADAVAERQALLRALSRASTQGEIESLHARLSLAGGAITHDREAFGALARRGSNSTVEVTVLGSAHAGGGLTLGKGLHDAGDVLRAALAALIIALAVLVPLAILLVLFALGMRATRRRARERALS
jgi:hypothetical protein